MASKKVITINWCMISKDLTQNFWVKNDFPQLWLYIKKAGAFL
jgi:hypothetical protein